MDKVSCSTDGGICMVSSFSREMEKDSQRTGETSSVLLVRGGYHSLRCSPASSPQVWKLFLLDA